MMTHSSFAARYSLALEESDVEDGRVEVQKLEHEHFKDETVFKFRNSSRKLCKIQRHNVFHKQTTTNKNGDGSCHS